MSWLRETTALALALALGGCSGKSDDKPEATESATTTAPAASPTPDDDFEISEAVPVALTCSSATAATYVKDPEASDGLTACLVVDAKARPVTVKEAAVIVRGADRAVAPALVAREVASPWTLGFRADEAVRARLQGIEVTVTLPSGQAVALTTGDDRYDWTKDPLFAELLALSAATSLGIYGNPVKFDEVLSYRTSLSSGSPVNLVFATPSVYPATIGVAGADGECARLGAAISPHLTWRALLSTSTESARSRIPFPESHLLVNIKGDVLAWKPDMLWTVSRAHGVRYGPKGEQVTRLPVPDTIPPAYSSQAWTGTAVGGGTHPAGTCNDWTSDAPEASAMTTNVHHAGPDTRIEHGLLSCSRRARLLCVSDAPPLWSIHSIGQRYGLAFHAQHYSSELWNGTPYHKDEHRLPARIRCPATLGTDGSLGVELWEDGVRLGPNNATESEIAALGGGRFHVFDGERGDVHVVFSSRDGSDPRTSGRRYELRCPDRFPAATP